MTPLPPTEKKPLIINTPSFSPVIDALKSAETILMTVHVGPDGDALGSMLALGLALKQYASHIKQIDYVVDGPVADVFTVIPGINLVRSVNSTDDFNSVYDVALCVDCGSGDRLGIVETPFKQAKISINLDHHVSNENFADINVVLTDAAASGEVVAKLLAEMNYPITADIAACLYITLVTDTGGFKFSNTTAYTHQLAAECLSKGIDHEKIYKQVYEQVPLVQAKLRAQCFSNAQYSHNNRLAWTVVPKALRNELGAKEEHTDGIVDLLRQIDTTELCVVFKETNNGQVKASLRSDNHHYDLVPVVERFGGGGHKMAAGCTMANMTLEKAQQAMIPMLEALLK